MSQDIRTKFIITAVITLVCGYVIAPIPNKPKIPFLSEAAIKEGVDLAGGAEIRYRVLYDPGQTGRDKMTAAATDVIRKRIEAKHVVKEPKIIAQGDDQIVVQIAGVDSDTLKEYKRLIEQTGTLELYEVAPVEFQEQFNKDGRIPGGDWTTIDNTERGGHRGGYEAYGAKVLVKSKPVIDGRNIVASEPRQSLDQMGSSQWVTTFELDADGAKFFDEAAARLYSYKPNPGMIAILLDKKLKSMPVVQSAHFGGHGQISGAKSEQEARELAIVLKSGALPADIGSFAADGKTKVPKVPEAETFVGPALGQDAIKRGLVASLGTLIVVSLFMIVYYRSSGVIAVISLALNLIYLMAIMAFFGATLTLPGIAGIVLTVGMAVDANILIYERIREEQARGKSATQAFDAGHDRAFITIIDCHVTTLIAAAVLYNLGTGPVQGFAVTLTIGVVTTLFSVLFCGKVFMKMLLSGGLKEFKYMSLFSNPNIDFLKIAKACVIGTSLVAVLGIVLFQVRGDKNFGIDFKGGTVIVFSMNKPMNIEEVRSKIQSVKDEKGVSRYEDATVQTVAEPEATRSEGTFAGNTARTFQMRSMAQDKAQLKRDLQEVFRNSLSHEPFEDVAPEDVSKNPRIFDSGPAGPGWLVYLKAEKVPSLDALKKKITDYGDIQKMLTKDSKGVPEVLLEEVPGAPEGLKKVRISIAKEDSEREGLRTRLQTALKSALVAELAQSPFLAEDNIGAAVAAELKGSTIWALIISWVGIIIYLAVRFEWRYGVAAVIALIHDALIAIGVTSMAGWLVPKSWGLSFEMNMTTLAAILTIIGYSVNDTIVVFDRIRENLHLMKKQTFSEIINASVNQTLSRTILTSFTVWITCVVLYAVTATTGGGIAEFSFPLIVGVAVGTYSSVYVAAPIVLWWYKGQKPATA
jgi:SecD/SecF fusion protein